MGKGPPSEANSESSCADCCKKILLSSHSPWLGHRGFQTKSEFLGGCCICSSSAPKPKLFGVPLASGMPHSTDIKLILKIDVPATLHDTAVPLEDLGCIGL